MAKNYRVKPRRSRLGRLLVLYRSAEQIGLREMAAESGVSHATLSRLERGHEMDARTLLKLWQWLLGDQPQHVAVAKAEPLSARASEMSINAGALGAKRVRS